MPCKFSGNHCRLLIHSHYGGDPSIPSLPQTLNSEDLANKDLETFFSEASVGKSQVLSVGGAYFAIMYLLSEKKSWKPLVNLRAVTLITALLGVFNSTSKIAALIFFFEWKNISFVENISRKYRSTAFSPPPSLPWISYGERRLDFFFFCRKLQQKCKEKKKKIAMLPLDSPPCSPRYQLKPKNFSLEMPWRCFMVPLLQASHVPVLLYEEGILLGLCCPTIICLSGLLQFIMGTL